MNTTIYPDYTILKDGDKELLFTNVRKKHNDEYYLIPVGSLYSEAIYTESMKRFLSLVYNAILFSTVEIGKHESDKDQRDEQLRLIIPEEFVVPRNGKKHIEGRTFAEHEKEKNTMLVACRKFRNGDGERFNSIHLNDVETPDLKVYFTFESDKNIHIIKTDDLHTLLSGEWEEASED